MKIRKYRIPILFGIISFIVIFAIFIQINTIKESSKDIGISITDKSTLRDELLRIQNKYNNLYEKSEILEKKLDQTRDSAITNNDAYTNMKNELDQLEDVLGLTKVKGEGIVITLDDNRELSKRRNGLNAHEYIVHEQDLIQIVNELFNAGADAISINDHRVVYNSSILCDGVIIRINGEKTGVPVTIKAIGYPERLYYAAIRPQGYLELMEQDGVLINVEKIKEIEVQKYSGIYSNEYINSQ